MGFKIDVKKSLLLGVIVTTVSQVSMWITGSLFSIDGMIGTVINGLLIGFMAQPLYDQLKG